MKGSPQNNLLGNMDLSNFTDLQKINMAINIIHEVEKCHLKRIVHGNIGPDAFKIDLGNDALILFGFNQEKIESSCPYKKDLFALGVMFKNFFVLEELGKEAENIIQTLIDQGAKDWVKQRKSLECLNSVMETLNQIREKIKKIDLLLQNYQNKLDEISEGNALIKEGLIEEKVDYEEKLSKHGQEIRSAATVELDQIKEKFLNDFEFYAELREYLKQTNGSFNQIDAKKARFELLMRRKGEIEIVTILSDSDRNDFKMLKITLEKSLANCESSAKKIFEDLYEYIVPCYEMKSQDQPFSDIDVLFLRSEVSFLEQLKSPCLKLPYPAATPELESGMQELHLSESTNYTPSWQSATRPTPSSTLSNRRLSISYLGSKSTVIKPQNL